MARIWKGGGLLLHIFIQLEKNVLVKPYKLRQKRNLISLTTTISTAKILPIFIIMVFHKKISPDAIRNDASLEIYFYFISYFSLIFILNWATDWILTRIMNEDRMRNQIQSLRNEI